MRFLSIIFIFLLFTFGVSAQEKNSNCRTATEVEIPLGGNHIITQNAGKVKQIKGTTTFWIDGKVFEDVVVEVYAVNKTEERDFTEKTWKIADNKKREVACVTGKNGKFQFSNLQKGLYILRIGTRTREVEYFNHVFVIVNLDPKNGKNKEINAALEVAN